MHLLTSNWSVNWVYLPVLYELMPILLLRETYNKTILALPEYIQRSIWYWSILITIERHLIKNPVILGWSIFKNERKLRSEYWCYPTFNIKNKFKNDQMIDQSHIKNGIRNNGHHITFNSMKTPYDDKLKLKSTIITFS